MIRTPHLTPDQLSALAERSAALPGTEAAFAHLAECENCRHALFLLAAPATRHAEVDQRWLLAAAALLALAVSLVFTRHWPARAELSPPVAGTNTSSLPKVFRQVSLAPSSLRQSSVRDLLPSAYGPQPDQFVVHTAAGERWISFNSPKFFSE